MYRYLYQRSSKTQDAVNYKCLQGCLLLEVTRACCGIPVCQETVKEVYTILEFPSEKGRRNCRQMAQVHHPKGQHMLHHNEGNYYLTEYNLELCFQ